MGVMSDDSDIEHWNLRFRKRYFYKIEQDGGGCDGGEDAEEAGGAVTLKLTVTLKIEHWDLRFWKRYLSKIEKDGSGCDGSEEAEEAGGAEGAADPSQAWAGGAWVLT